MKEANRNKRINELESKKKVASALLSIISSTKEDESIIFYDTAYS